MAEADFLASLAKNYKGDPFGAGMGLFQAREVTNFDPVKEREYYLGENKETITPAMIDDMFPNPAQVGKYDEPGEILAALRKLNVDLNPDNQNFAGWDWIQGNLGIGAKGQFQDLRRKRIEQFSNMYEKFAGGGGDDKYDRNNIDDVIKSEVTDKIVQAKKDDATDEEVVEEVTMKQRMANLFNDADKRDAILGGITDAMLETRVGADAYGNRFARAQRNVRDNLKLAEATQIARDKANLDAMKTLAETDKLTNPAQYLTNAQKEADAYVRARIATGDVTMDQYAEEYAKMLKQITVKDLTSAKAGSIKDLFAYAQALQSTDPDTAALLMDAIKANAIYLSSDGGTVSADSETIDASNYTTDSKG